MRKKLLFAGLLVFALSLCACSSTKSGNVSDLTNTGNDLLNVPETDMDETDYYDDAEYDDEEIVHDTEFYPTSFDGFKYESTLDELGEYKGLTYSYESSYVPTQQEIDDNVNEILEMYGYEALTDEVLTDFGFETKEELYEYIQTNLISSTNYENYANAATELLDSVIDNSKFTIKEEEVNSVVTEQLASYEEMSTYFGVSYEELVEQYFEQTVEEFENELKDTAEKSIKTTLVVKAIINDTNIDVKALWDEKSAELLEEYGYENAWDYVDMNGGEEYLIEEVMYKIVIEYIMENGTNLMK